MCNIGLSDHLPVCIARLYGKQQHAYRSSHDVIKYRNFRNCNLNDFLEDLHQIPWSVLDTFDDPDDALEYFNKAFLMVVESHAPLIQKRVRQNKQPRWMNEDILNLIHERDDHLLKKGKKNK